MGGRFARFALWHGKFGAPAAQRRAPHNRRAGMLLAVGRAMTRAGTAGGRAQVSHPCLLA